MTVQRFHERQIKDSGNVLFYVFLAIGLIAALTYAFVKDSRVNFAAQNAMQVAESLYVQTNMIRSTVQQCIMEYPEGGAGLCGVTFSCADLNRDGSITAALDNPNLPYPINPSDTKNPNALAGIAATVGTDFVRDLSCVGAPASNTRMFTGASNQGRFLPPPPPGFPEWTYSNTALGVYIRILNAPDAAAITRVRNKFNTCQADLNYAGCGANCLTVWLLRLDGC